MTITTELKRLAEKMTGKTVENGTTAEVLRDLHLKLTGLKSNGETIDEVLSDLADNYTGGGGGGDTYDTMTISGDDVSTLFPATDAAIVNMEPLDSALSVTFDAHFNVNGVRAKVIYMGEENEYNLTANVNENGVTFSGWTQEQLNSRNIEVAAIVIFYKNGYIPLTAMCQFVVEQNYTSVYINGETSDSREYEQSQLAEVAPGEFNTYCKVTPTGAAVELVGEEYAPYLSVELDENDNIVFDVTSTPPAGTFKVIASKEGLESAELTVSITIPQVEFTQSEDELVIDNVSVNDEVQTSTKCQPDTATLTIDENYQSFIEPYLDGDLVMLRILSTPIPIGNATITASAEGYTPATLTLQVVNK